MLYEFHRAIHGHGYPRQVSLRSMLWTTGTLILTILTILVLFLFVFATRAI